MSDQVQLNDVAGTLRNYLNNYRVLGGLLLIGIGLWLSFKNIPMEWGQYQQAIQANKTLQNTKNNLSQEEANLKALSKRLDQSKVKVLKVPAGTPPALAALNTAEGIAALCEATGNRYTSLEPKSQIKLKLDKAVKLTFSVSGDAQSPSSGAVATPTSRGGAQNEGPTLNAFLYTMEAQGSYINLAKFVHDLVLRGEEFVLIQQININTIPPEQGLPGIVRMEIDFAIPWNE